MPTDHPCLDYLLRGFARFAVGGGGGGFDNLLFYKYRKGVKIKQVKMTTRKETESETKTMWVYLFGF